MFESLAFAMSMPQDGTGSANEMLVQFVPLILMVAVFWFLLIRPQKKRQQEHKTMLGNLRRGDNVVTSGGLIGRITDIDGDILTLDLGEAKVRVGRGFVTGLFDGKVQQALKDGRKSEMKKKKPAVESDAAEADGESAGKEK